MPILVANGQITITDINDGYSVYLTKENHTYPASNTGVISDYTTGYSEVRVSKGGTWLTCPNTGTGNPTTDNTYRVTSISVSSGTMTYTTDISSNQYRIKPATMSTTQAVITLTITVKGTGDSVASSFTKTLTYSKSIKGDTGTTGSTGATGPASYIHTKYFNSIFKENWWKNKYTPSGTSVATTNPSPGAIRVTSTTATPSFNMNGIVTTPFDTSSARYIVIKYKFVSGVAPASGTIIFHGVDNVPHSVSFPLSGADTNWHLIGVDMNTAGANWTGDTGILGWTYQWANTSGTVMDLELIHLCTDLMSTTGQWMGTYTDTTLADSTSFGSYNWNKIATDLDWVEEWDATSTYVGADKVLTPKIFAGTTTPSITGVAIGDVNGFIGIKGYNAGNATFTLDASTGNGTIGGWSFDSAKISNANTLISSAGYISFGTTPPTAYGNNAGVWLGYSTDAKVSLYKDTSNYLQWDGSNLVLRGGASSSIGFGATAINTGSGVFFNGSGNAFRVGTAANARMQWDGTNLKIYNSSNQAIASFGATNTFAGLNTATTGLTAGTAGSGQVSISVDAIALGSTLPTSTAGTGFYIGKTGSFYIGTVASSTLSSGIQWDGNALNIKATNAQITGTSGWLGGSSYLSWSGTTVTMAGWTVGTTTISKAGITLNSAGYITAGTETNIAGMDGTGTGDTTVRIWAGKTYANRATAPFRVTQGGAMTSTSGSIGGWSITTASIQTGAYNTSGTMYFGTSGLSLSNTFKVTPAGVLTASSGSIGGWTIGGTTLASGTGVTLDSSNKSISISNSTWGLDGIQLQYNAGNPRAYIGNGAVDGTGRFFNFDGTNLSWQGANTSLTTAGAFTATSATIKGVITADTGYIGGTAGWVIAANDLSTSSATNKIRAVSTAILSNDTGFYLGGDGKVRFGTVASGALSNGLYFDGTNLIINTPNFSVDSDGDVTITGTMTANTGYIGGTTNGWQITAGAITALGAGVIRTATSGARVEIASTGIKGYNATVQTTEINSDGSGWVGLTGTRAIEWTTAGVVSVADWTINASTITSGNMTLAGGAAPYIKVGTVTSATDTAHTGVYIDNSGNIIAIGDANNYIQRNGTTLAIKSSSFSLASGSLVLDTTKIKFGTVTSKTDTAHAGVWIDGTAGEMVISSGANNYLKKTTTTLEIKATLFDLLAGTAGTSQVGINASRLALGATLPTAYNSGSGFFVDNTGKLLVGNAAGSRLQWTGTNIEIYSANTKMVSLGASNTIAGWTITSTTLSSNNITLDSAGAIKGNYTPGLSGWNVNSSGDAEFNNAVIRGSLRTTALQYGQVLATNGSVWVVPSVGKTIVNFTSVDSPTTFNIDIEDPQGMTHAAAGGLWVANDIVRIKEPLAGDLWAKVSAKVDGGTYWRLTVVKQSPAAGTNYTFTKGATVLNYKQAASGMIQLTADEDNSPYLQMNIHGGTPWNNDDTTGMKRKLRLGNLNGSGGYTADTYGLIAGNKISYDLSTSGGRAGFVGFSLEDTNGLRLFNTNIQMYSGNTQTVDISKDGIIIAGSGSNVAGINGIGTTTNTVRLWAGDTYNNKEIAPFRVTQEGTVTIADSNSHDRVYLGSYQAETVTARAGTDIGVIYCDYATVNIGDKVINTTRSNAKSVVTSVSSDYKYFIISPSITGQTTGDSIVIKPFGLKIIQGRVEADVIISGARSASFVIADGATTPKKGRDRADYIVPVGSTSAQTTINNAITALPMIVMNNGTVAAAGTNILTLGSTASTIEDEYTSYTITITGGLGVGQTRTIIGYNTSKVATLDSAWTTQPDISSTYEVRTHIGKIVLLEGTFVLDGAIYLSSNVTIEGQGAGTVLRLKTATNVNINLLTNIDTAIGNQNIAITSLQIDGNKLAQTTGVQNGIYLRKSFNCKVRDVIIYGMRDGGIEINNATPAATSTTAEDGNNIISGNFLYGNGSGIKIYGSDNNTIVSNTVEYNGYGVAVYYSDNTNISNNSVISSTGNGIYVKNSTSASLIGNTYNGLVAFSGNGIWLDMSTSCTVQTNTILNSVVGIKMTGSSTNTITNNRVNVTSSHGIYILDDDSSNPCLDNRISDNIVYKAGTDCSNIYVDGDSSRNVISKNTIRSGSRSKYGITLTIAVTYNSVLDNDINDTFVTGYFLNSANTTNVVFGNKTTSSNTIGGWMSTTNNDIYYNGGKIGINKTPTTYHLEVDGDVQATNFRGTFVGSLPSHAHTATAGDGGVIPIANTSGTLSVARGGTGQTTFTNGQLLIGNTTGNTLSKATLTAGSNITITNAAGAITIASSYTNTTYSAGYGLTLTGTSFSVDPYTNAELTAGTMGEIVSTATGIYTKLGTNSKTAYRGDYGNSAYAHISTNGSSHTFINQNVTTTASPTFVNAYVTKIGVAGVTTPNESVETAGSVKAVSYKTASWEVKQDATTGSLKFVFG